MSESVDPRSLPVRFTRLKEFAKSPAHYLWAVRNDTDKACYRNGRALHSMWLGGKRIVVYDGKRDKRVKAYQEFLEENKDAEILSAKEREIVVRMHDALMRNEYAMQLHRRSRHEMRIDWDIMGRACQSTLDGIGRWERLIFDLKMCRTSRPGWFDKSALGLHYHAQLAFYQAAATWLDAKWAGSPGPAFVIAVENQPPYNVTVFELTERALEQGRAACHSWLEQLLACESTNHWPGYAERIVPLDAPEIEPDLIFACDEGEENDSYRGL